MASKGIGRGQGDVPGLSGDSAKSFDVEKFHENDDLDATPRSHHHTLGPTRNQASPGDHDHGGGTSKALFDGIVITGLTQGSASWCNAVETAMRRLGAT